MYFYYDVIYYIMMYFRCEYYMGGLLESLTDGYRQSIVIIP